MFLTCLLLKEQGEKLVLLVCVMLPLFCLFNIHHCFTRILFTRLEGFYCETSAENVQFHGGAHPHQLGVLSLSPERCVTSTLTHLHTCQFVWPGSPAHRKWGIGTSQLCSHNARTHRRSRQTWHTHQHLRETEKERDGLHCAHLKICCTSTSQKRELLPQLSLCDYWCSNVDQGYSGLSMVQCLAPLPVWTPHSPSCVILTDCKL